MYQGGLLHELYFIAINNRGQAIIGPNKKTVAMYVLHGDMNPENGVLL